MSNNTTTNAVDASAILFSEPYLRWLENDLFPYIFGSCGVVILILGGICNAILAKVYHKRGGDGTTAITSQLIVGDILAYIFVIAPGIYFSFSKSTTLNNNFCQINGIGVLLGFVSQFGFLTVCLMLSLITLRKRSNSPGLLQRKMVIVVCSLVVWVTTLVLAVIPFLTGTKYEYNGAEYQCRTDRKTLHVLMNAVFFFTLFLSLIVGTVNFFTTVYTHLKGKPRNLDETENIQNADGIELVRTHDTPGNNDRANALDDDTTEGRDQHLSMKEDSIVPMENEQSSTPKDKQNLVNETSTVDKINGTNETEDSAEVPEKENTGIESNGNNADVKEGDDALNSSAKTSSADASTPLTPVMPSDDKSDETTDETSHTLQPNSNNSRIRLTPSTATAANSRQFKLKNKWKAVSKKIVTLNRVTDNFAAKSRVAETFSDLSKLIEESSVKNTDIRACVSYLTTWITVFLLWTPYLLISYVDAYGPSTWWNGWYTIAVFCANCSYCVKPIVLLASKKDLRKESEAVMPGKVSKNASSVKSIVNRIMR